MFNKTISPEQLANDYCELRYLLNKLGYQDSIVVGPEANHIADKKNDYKGINYMKKFIENIKGCIDYVTWHQYNLNGHIAKVEDFVNAASLNRLPEQIKSIIESVNMKIPMWLCMLL